MRVHFIQHVSFENPGNLLHWAKEENHTVTFTIMEEDPALPNLEAFDMLVIMGGPMGVYEEDIYDWLKPEKEFIKAAIYSGKKVLGICLGSQLIAEALGSKVYPHIEKEIGWWPVHKLKNESAAKLMEGLPDNFITYHWHGDTFDLPEGAVQLFKTNACSQQGFLWGKNVATIQFHPEATNELVMAMINHGKDELVESPYIQTKSGMISVLPKHIPLQPSYMRSFVKNFLGL